MEERLAEPLRRSIARAHTMAAARNLSRVLPEHLFAAILLENPAAAVRWAGSEFAFGRLCQEVLRELGRHRRDVAGARVTELSPEVKLALAVASDIRRWSGETTLRLEHALLALLNDEDSRPARALEAARIDAGRARDRLSGAPPSSEPSARSRIVPGGRRLAIRTELLVSARGDGRQGAVARAALAFLFYVAGVAALLRHGMGADRTAGWLFAAAALFGVFFILMRRVRLYFERR